MKLRNKVAVITGGSSGIGLASAKLFSAEGARVIIISTRQHAVDAAVEQLGRQSLGFAGDVSKLDDLDRIYEQIKHDVGQIDILFANAGVASFEPFGAVEEQNYDRLFDVNAKGLFFTVQKALPLLRDAGVILLNASVAHLMAAPDHHVYAGTKAAVRAFARNWAFELKSRKIRVNCISPGLIETPIFGKTGLDTKGSLDVLAPIFERMPLGRLGKVEEAASAALFLVSDDSSFITGSDLCIDGCLSQV